MFNLAIDSKLRGCDLVNLRVRGITPVSYTHLDVYKRQDKDSLLLSGWLKNYDELGVAYRLKENFFGIYDAQSPDEAQGLSLIHI